MHEHMSLHGWDSHCVLALGCCVAMGAGATYPTTGAVQHTQSVLSMSRWSQTHCARTQESAVGRSQEGSGVMCSTTGAGVECDTLDRREMCSTPLENVLCSPLRDTSHVLEIIPSDHSPRSGFQDLPGRTRIPEVRLTGMNCPFFFDKGRSQQCSETSGILQISLRNGENHCNDCEHFDNFHCHMKTL